MGRRLTIVGMLIAIAAVAVLAASASANAQSPDGSTCSSDGVCSSPGCAPNERCIDPGVPSCPPDVLCTEPAPCVENEPCGSPGNPGPDCPEGSVCIDPVPCDAGPNTTCPEPAPLPCPADFPEKCDFGDTDEDSWADATEEEWGSNPDDAASTPEHGYVMESCTDGADNDGDGSVDVADEGCNIDSDEDGRIDAQDNCPWDANADQADRDGDNVGDPCDYDADNDNWDDYTEGDMGSDPNNASSTPEHFFMKETCEDGTDNDLDGAADASEAACAPDNDYDKTPDVSDNCPTAWNEDQTDNDADGAGDACEDNDSDGFFDADETANGSDPNSAASVPEGGVNFEACTDGVDNDLDGTTDDADQNCQFVALEDGIFPPGDGAEATGAGLTRANWARDLAADRDLPVLPAAGSGASNRGFNDVWWLIAGAATVVVVLTGSSFWLRGRERA